MRRGCFYFMLILAPALAHGSGWTPEIWDRTNTCGRVISANLIAVSVTDVVWQVSNTNIIPEVGEFAGYWKYDEHQTNSLTRTNSYFLHVGTDTNWLSFLSNSVSVLVTTNINFPVDGFTNVVTTTVTRTQSGGEFSFNLDTDDRRAFEVYQALYEREWWTSGTNIGVKFYMDNRKNLIEAKNWLASNMSKYIDTIQSSNWSNTWDGTDWVYPTGVVEFAYYNWWRGSFTNWPDIPTNYLFYTPYKFNTLGREVTQAVTILKYNWTGAPVWEADYGWTNDIFTNLFYRYDGRDPILFGDYVSGTNGQIIQQVVVNSNVQDGFVNSDYYYWPITNILHYVYAVEYAPEYVGASVVAGEKKAYSELYPDWIDVCDGTGCYYFETNYTDNFTTGLNPKFRVVYGCCYDLGGGTISEGGDMEAEWEAGVTWPVVRTTKTHARGKIAVFERKNVGDAAGSFGLQTSYVSENDWILPNSGYGSYYVRRGDWATAQSEPIVHKSGIFYSLAGHYTNGILDLDHPSRLCSSEYYVDMAGSYVSEVECSPYYGLFGGQNLYCLALEYSGYGLEQYRYIIDYRNGTNGFKFY